MTFLKIFAKIILENKENPYQILKKYDRVFCLGYFMKIKILKKQNIQKIFFSLMLVLFFEIMLVPSPVLAHNNNAELKYLNADKTVNFFNNINTTEKINNGLISATNNIDEKIEIAWTSTRVITAYTSEVAQCDSSPCITANGFNVCEHGIEDTVAVNWLKFGTRIRIPDLFGDRIFVVRDRMNKKHNDKVDIWMINKKDALKFGKKVAKIEVLK